jgi:hypothetical protein
MTLDTIPLPVWVYLVIAIVNAVEWSPELWAKFPNWLRILIEVLRALGPDVVKAGKKAGPGVKAFLPFLFVAAVGCVPTQYPRHVARGAVLSVAYGVQVADGLCQEAAEKLAGDVGEHEEPEKPGSISQFSEYRPRKFSQATHFAFTADAKANVAKAIEVSEKCDRGYQVARAGLLAAAHAVDAWDQADNGAVGCGVLQGIEGLRYTEDAAKLVGVKVMPQSVQDAYPAAEFMIKIAGGSCKL